MHHPINRSVEFSSSKFFAEAFCLAKSPRTRHPSLSTISDGASVWSSEGVSPADIDAETVEVPPNVIPHVPVDATNTASNLADAAETDTTSDECSLKDLLPKARFFSGENIVFSSIAESAENCTPGQLVVYRLGVDCPDELISQALARGAAGVLTEQILPAPLPQCIVSDTDRALAEITANQLADETGARPDQRLITVGIVGDSGKSTTALCMATVLRESPCRVAYETDLTHSDGIGTEVSADAYPSGAELLVRLSEAADAGAAVSIIELNDQALRSGGYDSVQFDILVVVGRSERRNDFGPTSLETAIERVSREGVLVIPASDEAVNRAAQESGLNVFTYDVDSAADLSLQTVRNEDGCLTAMISHEMNSALLESMLGQGLFPTSLAAAAAVGVITHNPLVQIAESLSQLREVPGRCERISNPDWDTAQQQPEMILDVAGTPERLAFLLRSIRELAAQRSEDAAPILSFTKKGLQQQNQRTPKLWCVLAVDRCDSAETLMLYGRLLETMPDHCVLTCHPSSKEQFLSLSHGVLDGVEDCAAMRLVADQERAIQWAVQGAGAHDTVVVVGAVDRTSPQSQRGDLARLKEVMSGIPSTEVKPLSHSNGKAPSLKLFHPDA